MVVSLYDLSKLYEKIEDCLDNFMCFLIIGNQEVLLIGDDKILIIVFMCNKLGVLYELLVLFYNNGIDLICIEICLLCSGKWIYVFFIDFVGYYKELLIKDVLEKIGQEVVVLKVLGFYLKVVF